MSARPVSEPLTDPDEVIASTVLQRYRARLASVNAIDAVEAEHLTAPELVVSQRMYLCLVSGLATAYPRALESALHPLSIAAYGMYRMQREAEALAGGAGGEMLPRLLLHQAVVLDALREVFAGDAPLREWQERWSEQWSAVQSARSLDPHREFGEMEFRQLALAKSSMLALAVDWLERLQPQPQRASRLRSALGSLHVAMQWIEDLRHFEANARDGRRSLAGDRCARLPMFQDGDGSLPGPAAVRRLFYASGAAEGVMADAMSELQGAREQARLAGCDWLVYVIDGFLKKGRELGIAVTAERVAAMRGRVGVSSPASVADAGQSAAGEDEHAGLMAELAGDPSADLALGDDAEDGPVLGALYIQPRRPGEWLVGSESGRHAVVDAQMLAVLRAVQHRSSRTAAFNAYLLCGGSLERQGFDEIAERGLRLLAMEGNAQSRTFSTGGKVFGAGFTNRIASLLAPLFRQGVLLLCLPLVVAGIWGTWAGLAVDMGGHAKGWHVVLAAGLVLLGWWVHEMGHVVALRRNGKESAGISLGVHHRLLPTLRADLNNACRLLPAQRLLVNLGGSWLQLVYAGALLVTGLLLPEGGARGAVGLAASASTLLALLQWLPVAGTDAYRVAMDVSGQSDLASYEASLWQRVQRLEGKAWLQLAYLLLSWGVLLALLGLAARPAATQMVNLVGWLRGSVPPSEPVSHAGWIALMASGLLLWRLFVQARAWKRGRVTDADWLPATA